MSEKMLKFMERFPSILLFLALCVASMELRISLVRSKIESTQFFSYISLYCMVNAKTILILILNQTPAAYFNK